MSDFGATLRNARERRGVSLQSIAEATKISVAALEALERNDPSRLPGGIFSRAIVRSYAAAVGLDPNLTVRAFLTRFNMDHAPVVMAPERAGPKQEPPVAAAGRLGARAMKIVLASLLIAAAIVYLALGPT